MRLPAFVALLALCTVPTCASVPPEATGLPAFPIVVPSTRGPVPVVLVHHLAKCGALGDSTQVWFGCYHYGPPRFIEVEDTLSPEWRWRTLEHEMVHLALAEDGATLPDADAENRVAEAIAKQRVHAMLLRWPR